MAKNISHAHTAFIPATGPGSKAAVNTRFPISHSSINYTGLHCTWS